MANPIMVAGAAGRVGAVGRKNDEDIKHAIEQPYSEISPN